MFKIFSRLGNFFLKPSIRYKLFQYNIFTPHPDEVIFKYAFEFINHHKIEGDYLEFGVWKGRSFSRAFNIWKHLFKDNLKNIRFFAFDSFQGLPETNESSEFKKGQYFLTERNFKNNIVSNGVDLSKVIIIPGWFKDTLNNETKKTANLSKVAIVFIDCDLYESAREVMNFLTDIIQEGTILIFDDWFAFKGNSNRGEQKAVKEWLIQNSNIKLIEWQSINWRSKAFIVHV